MTKKYKRVGHPDLHLPVFFGCFSSEQKAAKEFRIAIEPVDLLFVLFLFLNNLSIGTNRIQSLVNLMDYKCVASFS